MVHRIQGGCSVRFESSVYLLFGLSEMAGPARGHPGMITAVQAPGIRFSNAILLQQDHNYNNINPSFIVTERSLLPNRQTTGCPIHPTALQISVRIMLTRALQTRPRRTASPPLRYVPCCRGLPTGVFGRECTDPRTIARQFQEEIDHRKSTGL